MPHTITTRSATGPIRIRYRQDTTVSVKIATGPMKVRVIGAPGPQGQKGDRGAPGRDGVAALPEDVIINGGFF